MILCLVGKTATSTVTFVAGIYTAEVFPTAIRQVIQVGLGYILAVNYYMIVSGYYL